METFRNFFLTFFFLHSIRMSGKNMIFNDKKINKSNFYRSKKTFVIGVVGDDNTYNKRFFVSIKVTLVDCFIIKIYVLSTHSYTM